MTCEKPQIVDCPTCGTSHVAFLHPSPRPRRTYAESLAIWRSIPGIGLMTARRIVGAVSVSDPLSEPAILGRPPRRAHGT